MMDQSTTLNLRANLEPLPGLKIDLTGNRVVTQATEIQYMYSGMPEQQTGSYSMTMVALGSLSGSGNAQNGYASKSFDKFLEHRDIIANRLQSAYNNASYPNSGFLENSSIAGMAYNQELGSVSRN